MCLASCVKNSSAHLNSTCYAVGLDLLTQETDFSLWDKKKRLWRKHPDLKGFPGYTEDQVVSSDFMSYTHSSTFHVMTGIQLSPTFAKLLVSCYDNDNWYSNRVVDLLEYLANVSSVILLANRAFEGPVSCFLPFALFSLITCLLQLFLCTRGFTNTIIDHALPTASTTRVGNIPPAVNY